MKAYLAFITEEDAGFGVVFPDLPGCVSVGDTFEDAMVKGGEALALYAEALRADNQAMPVPRSLKQIKAAKLDWIEPGYTVAAIPLIAPRKQTTRINVALDQTELEAIDAAAEKAGVDRSTYMVRASLYAAAPASFAPTAIITVRRGTAANNPFAGYRSKWNKANSGPDNPFSKTAREKTKSQKAKRHRTPRALQDAD